MIHQQATRPNSPLSRMLLLRHFGDIALNLLVPGITQITYGKVQRGIVLYLLFHILIFACVFVALQPFQPFNIIFSISIFVSVYTFIIIDGLMCAKVPDKKLNVQPILATVLLVGLLIIDSSIVKKTVNKMVRENITEAFQISSSSMYPSLLSGDFILASKLPHNREPKRGDVLVFHLPSDASRTLIKRVIGLSGETIEIKDNIPYINNATLKEEYLGIAMTSLAASDEAPKDFGPATVPRSSLFVLNDNREYGQDSRSWGFLEKNKIIGTATTIYWSWDKESHSIRWHRIGKVIK